MKGLVTASALALVPIATLIFTLVQSGYWGNSTEPLAGEYIFGGSYNPLGEFFALFIPAVLAFIVLSLVSLNVARRYREASSYYRLRLMLIVLFILLASISLGFSMTLAPIAHFWFRSGPTFGTTGSFAPFYVGFILSFVILVVNLFHYQTS